MHGMWAGVIQDLLLDRIGLGLLFCVRYHEHVTCMGFPEG